MDDDSFGDFSFKVGLVFSLAPNLKEIRETPTLKELSAPLLNIFLYIRYRLVHWRETVLESLSICQKNQFLSLCSTLKVELSTRRELHPQILARLVLSKPSLCAF